MPNINFDIFYDTDVINVTASRGTNAPKVKPAWKVRSAPKLPPKQPPVPKVQQAFGAPEQPKKQPKRITELPDDADSVTGEVPDAKKQVPKLQKKEELNKKASDLNKQADSINKAKSAAPKVGKQ